MYFDLQKTPEYKTGLECEIKAQNIIRKFEKVEIIETCNNSDFDFKDSNGKTYEVKNDSLSIKTKHFFITFKQQFKNNNYFQPAGISNSKSDYYMLRYGNEFYKIKTAILKMIIFNNIFFDDDDKEAPQKKYDYIEYNNNRGDLIHGIRVPVIDIEAYVKKYLIED